MSVREIQKELTTGRGESLNARRRIAAIAAGLAADFALIGMRQYGVIRKLPDLPGRTFDSNAVITSPAAYPFGIPDAAIVVTGLGGIIALATARGSKRTGRGAWLDKLLAGAVAMGAAGATYYLHEMIVRQRRLCAYCLVGAAGFYAMVPALRHVLTRGKSL
jgi:uncharacterized membrane protein